MLRPILERTLLLAFSLLFSAVLFEVGYRIIYFRPVVENGSDLREQLERSRSVEAAPQGNISSLRGMIAPSAFPDIVYELKPNLNVTFQGKPVRTNSIGIRGSDLPTEKPADVFRIVGIGDSVMFGWGVEEHETYLEQLASRLNQSGELKKRVEVLNFGVPGYNTSMEVATLERKARQFSPDLIVLHFIKNDWEVPSFMLRPEDPWSLKRCYLCEFVTSRLGYLNRDSAKLVGVDFTGVSGQEKWQVIDEYRYMLGARGFVDASAKLAGIAAEMKVPVLLITGSSTSEQKKIMDRVVKRWGMEKVQVKETVDRYFADLGRELSKKERGEMIRLSPSDPHPNPLGHQLYAAALYEPVLRHLKER